MAARRRQALSVCPVCRCSITVTAAGLVRVHGPVSARCAGSREAPCADQCPATDVDVDVVASHVVAAVDGSDGRRGEGAVDGSDGGRGAMGLMVGDGSGGGRGEGAVGGSVGGREDGTVDGSDGGRSDGAVCGFTGEGDDGADGGSAGECGCGGGAGNVQDCSTSMGTDATFEVSRVSTVVQATTSPSLPSLLSVVQTPIPTFQHVPKCLRVEWAKVVKEVFSSVCSHPSNVSSWTKLFMLAKCVLASPVNAHRSRWRDTQNLIRSRLRRWSAGDLSTLWVDALAAGKAHKRKHRTLSASSDAVRRANIRRAKRALESGQYSKAIQALTSEGLASITPEVVQDMRNKHPSAPPPQIPSDPSPPPLTSMKLGSCVP